MDGWLKALIGVLVFLALGLLAAVVFLSRLVKKRSGAIARLTALNADYAPMAALAQSGRHIFSARYTSKAAYDRADLSDLLGAHLWRERDFFARAVAEADFYAFRYLRYREACDVIYAEHKMTAWTAWLEKRLFDRMRMPAPEPFTVEIGAEYKSKSGRLDAKKSRCFDLRTVDGMLRKKATDDPIWEQNVYARGFLSHTLRYEGMKRDAFACVFCGGEAIKGTRLHVRYKLPLHAGGKPDCSNLYTVCELCAGERRNGEGESE